MKKRKLISQQAFTFVEVLVATLIVALVMTALGSMMALSARVAEANEMEQLAQLKAQQAIEFFRRERLVRGWKVFAESLVNNTTYCLNDLPSNINTLVPGNCASVMQDFNFFYYQIETNIVQNSDLLPEPIDIQINIFRYDKSGNLIGDPGEAFYTVTQTFKQY